jgi:AraC-like DNA-binding protein
MYCDTLDNVLPLQVWQTNGSIHKIKIYAGRGQYDEALKMADKAMQLAAVDKQRLNEIRRLKMDILAKTGQADELHKLALYTIESNDSLYRKDLAYQVDELRTRYDVDKHDREMKFIIRYASIATVAGILLIIVLTIWIYYSSVVKNKNRFLMRKISEQDILIAEQKRQHEHNSNEVDAFTKFIVNNSKDPVFTQLNTLILEKKIFIQKKISRISIAKMLGINEKALYNCIKRNTGLGFIGYITYIRLAYAREQLADVSNQSTMEKIAQDSGFGSRVTLYRLFKDIYNTTPDEFRRNERNKQI